jgi:hypothetical protein
MCGGFRNKRAKLIKIIRADGSVVDVDVKNLMAGSGERILLYPGDTLYVPDTFTVPWGLISTILSITSLTVLIVLNINRLSGS